MGRKLTIEEMQNISVSRGGKCLSNRLTNQLTSIKLQCALGHIWFSNGKRLKQDQWCPFCAGNVKLSLDDIQKIARSKGGECLSKEYLGSNIPLMFRCKNNHVWKTKPSHIRSGHWCAKCSFDKRKLTLEDVEKLAKNKGGTCLSERYINCRTKLRFQCKEGHIFEMKQSKVKEYQWCPICSKGIRERICRAYFEEIFKEKFPHKRPSWLRSPKHNKMELDGYCKKLKLAFEYNGEQHYNSHRHFHKTRSLREQQKYDALKRELCGDRGVNLIEIPYDFNPTKIGGHILQICKKKGLEVPDKVPKLNYNQSQIYSYSWLEELKKIAKQKGGKCLSNRYIDSNTHLKFRCINNHIWQATPSKIKQGRWCPYCVGRNKTVKDVQILAEQNGGRCISNNYINSNEKLLFECSSGHKWFASYNRIQQGTWCPVCANEARRKKNEVNADPISQPQSTLEAYC